jgi:hypothetical protein
MKMSACNISAADQQFMQQELHNLTVTAWHAQGTVLAFPQWRIPFAPSVDIFMCKESLLKEKLEIYPVCPPLVCLTQFKSPIEFAVQVEELCTQIGTHNDRLLLQLETDMLLGLMVHQLTASIPASHPGAQAVHDETRHLGCPRMLSLMWSKADLHQLPLPAAYTGPQLALQVMPCLLGAPTPPETDQPQQPQQPQLESPLAPLPPPEADLPGQQQQCPLRPPAPAEPELQGQQQECRPQQLQQQPSQQQQQQQIEWYTVTPSAQVLTEHLPLLASYCLSRLQEQQQRRQQLLSTLQQGNLQAVGAPGSSPGILNTLSKWRDSVHQPTLPAHMQYMSALLGCTVLPAAAPTLSEVQAAGSDCTPNPGGAPDSLASHRWVLSAPAAAVQCAGEVARVYEAVLRDAAAMCEAAAQLYSDDRVAAAHNKDLFEIGPGKPFAMACVTAAEANLVWWADGANAIIQHIGHEEAPEPSPLVLAAIAAGPGSDLQRQLFSLLYSMAKVGTTPIAAMVPESTAAAAVLSESTAARQSLTSSAAIATAALIAGAATQQQQYHPGGGSSHAASASAAAMLPGLFTLGRCCVATTDQNPRAEEYIAALAQLLVQPEKSTTLEVVLPPVQQWVQASSIQEQLTAAGYAPQALSQLLQQVLNTVQAVRGSVADGGQLDTFGFPEAVQEMRAAGNALCSFAVPSLCNNPGCVNTAGLTELGLASGRSCLCGGCLVARYCGRACQRAVWKQHKPVCTALAAAAAAAVAAAAMPAAAVATGPPPAATAAAAAPATAAGGSVPTPPSGPIVSGSP